MKLFMNVTEHVIVIPLKKKGEKLGRVWNKISQDWIYKKNVFFKQNSGITSYDTVFIQVAL